MLSNVTVSLTVNYDGTITGLLDSQLANSAVTRGYVESLAMGLKPNAPVRVMVQNGSNEHINYISAGRGVGKTLTAPQNGAFNYQGLNYSQGDRIGLMFYGYQRVDAGIYILTQVGDADTPWILTRATDFDGSSSFDSKQSDILFVLEGTYAQCMFIETQRGSEPNTGNLVIDTDLITWELFHAPQDLVFAQGLQQIGQAITVKPDATTGDTIIPVTVSTAGVGVQKSIITDIAEEKKDEANTYTDQAKADAISQSEAFATQLKAQSDQDLQTTYAQTQTNDQTVQTAAKTYTDNAIQGVNQEITALAATIPSPSSSKPYIYPQFF